MEAALVACRALWWSWLVWLWWGEGCGVQGGLAWWFIMQNGVVDAIILGLVVESHL